MAILTVPDFRITITPQPAEGTLVSAVLSPARLMLLGFNLPVEISTASIFRKPPAKAPFPSITVIAHFDTGASVTSVDIELAKYLNLTATGQSESNTASGKQVMPNFAVDIAFPGTKLSPFYNLRIGSCRLGFDLENNMKPERPQNMGILLGRDIMSRWNIVWNGPASSVTVSD